MIDGYAVPLPINFCQGGISTTGKHLFAALKHGITADNYLDGTNEGFTELQDDGDRPGEVKAGLEKLAKLKEMQPLGMRWEEFIARLSESLTDGGSNYLYTLFDELVNEQASVLGESSLLGVH